MKKTYIFLSFILLSITAVGQKNAYNFEIKNLKDTVVYLANYYGEKLYYADTARVDANGKFGFTAIPEENQGKFAVVIPGPKFFEIVVADNEKINITADTTDLVNSVKVLSSENNKLLYGYMDFLKERRKERETLVAKLEEAGEDAAQSKAIKTEYNTLNERVSEYQITLAKENPNLFAAKEIYMSVEPSPPAAILEDKQAAYYYYKNHYFDNIDLKDDRIIRSPVFHGRLVNYMNKTLIQDPDTIIKAIDKLVAGLEKGSEVYKYVVHYTTYNFETSKIMGMDKVFVHMVDTYYREGSAYWMDDDKLEAIKEKADEKRNTLIGLKAPELILVDTLGNWISTYKDGKKKYTLLYFYDPDCGHCKKETPKLVEFYNSYEPKNLSIFAISSDHDIKWNKFIRKNKMNFFNLSIPQRAYDDADYATGLITSGTTTYKSLKYQETFDIFSTPKVFLLDEHNVIRAKDISVEQIEDFINRLEGVAVKDDEEKADTTGGN